MLQFTTLNLSAPIAEMSPILLTVDRLARTPISQVVLFALGCTLVRLALVGYLKNTPAHKVNGTYKFASFVNEMADALVYAGILVFLLVRPFAIQTFTIPSGSMIPTLLIGDTIVADKWTYRVSDPKRGDIIVFRPPVEGRDPRMPNADYIKRCVGIPGDIIEFRDGDLYRNGQKVEESFAARTKQVGSSVNDLEVVPRDQWDERTSIPDFKLVNQNGKFIPVLYTGNFANFTVYTAPAYQVTTDEEQQALLKSPPVAVPPGYYLMVGDNRNGSYDSRSWGLVPRDAIVGRSWVLWLPINRARVTR